MRDRQYFMSVSNAAISGQSTLEESRLNLIKTLKHLLTKINAYQYL
jgi:hypothetical protein